ncbi:protein kinase [Nocardia sp. NPDC058176]|uniref:serine/threonine-protein kinase n=1 Tax=Nocardia sp. NPDC058176 TaxID=3346368 RepID=UPI0036DF4C9A
MLGKGGMGEVYEAYDTGKDRVVALKLLAEELAQDPAYQVRFRRESQAAAKLAEPHVIPIHDWGVIDGVLFIDMRLVPGTDLRSVLHTGGPLSPERAVAVVEQIAAALDAAHAGGLVHRDVKPANILVTPADFAYLADFGIAHTEGDSAVTQVGMAMGSYIYMAPERFDVGPVSHRADVYSLACVLHECLTGASPFPAASMSVLVRAHLSEAPPRPSTLLPGLPAALDDVIARGMAKDPADRYATAGDLAIAARDALASAFHGGAPRPPAYPAYGQPGAYPGTAPNAPGRSTGSHPTPVVGRDVPAGSAAAVMRGVPGGSGTGAAPLAGPGGSRGSTGAMPLAGRDGPAGVQRGATGSVPLVGRDAPGPGSGGPRGVPGSGTGATPLAGRDVPAGAQRGASGSVPLVGRDAPGPGVGGPRGVPGSGTGASPLPGRDSPGAPRGATGSVPLVGRDVPGGPGSGGPRGVPAGSTSGAVPLAGRDNPGPAGGARGGSSGSGTGGHPVAGRDAPGPAGGSRGVPGSGTGPVPAGSTRTAKNAGSVTGAGRVASGAEDDEDDQPQPTPTGEFRVVGAVTATGGIETSRSQTSATGAQPTLIIRPPEPRPGSSDTTGFRRVPVEGSGEVSIPAVIQPTGPAEIRVADTHFTPLPPADGPVEAPEPPPAYTPDQGLPRMRPFPDAHLYGGDHPGETSGPIAQPTPPYPAPTGPHRLAQPPHAAAQPPGPDSQRANPTQRYSGEHPVPAAPFTPPTEQYRPPPNPRSAPTQHFAGDPDARFGPAGASPDDERNTPDTRFGSPAAQFGDEPGPRPSAPTQRYGDDPDVGFGSGTAGFDNKEHGSDDGFGPAETPFGAKAHAEDRFGPTGAPFDDDRNAPDARFGASAAQFGDGHGPRPGAPTERYDDDAGFGSGSADRFGPTGAPFDDDRDARFGGSAAQFGDDRAPRPSAPTQRYGDNSDAEFGSDAAAFATQGDGPDTHFGSPAAPFGADRGSTRPVAPTQRYSDDPDAGFGPRPGFDDDEYDDRDVGFGAPTEQYPGRAPQGDPQRFAATQHYGAAGQFGPPTEQFDPAGFDAQRAAPTQHYGGAPTEQYDADPQRAQATHQYRGGAAPFAAHQAAPGDHDDPAAATRQYTGSGEPAYSQYDDANAYGDHAYRDPAHGPDPAYGPEPAYDPGRQHEPRRNRAWLLPVLLGVVGLVVVVIGGAIGWRLMSSADTTDTTAAATTAESPAGAGGPTATTAPRATTTAPTTTAGPVTLPAGAQPCESGAAGGAYGSAAVGTTVTSCGFAEAVREAYVAGGTSGRTGPQSVVATSPVTGRAYTMTCTPDGKLVTCTGGDNAVVYVY